MSEASHLAGALEGLFSAPEFYWFPTFPAAAQGLTADQAAASPGPRLNSVWGVTLHLTVCHRLALALLCGDPSDMNVVLAEGMWPPIRDPGNEAAWQQAVTELLALNHVLAECVAGLSDTDLERELAPTGMIRFQFIQGQLTHNSYHLSEIVTLRHMQGLWLEKT
jgi:hypothetical protein